MKSAAILWVVFFTISFTGNNLSAQFPFPKLKLKYYTVADGLSNNNVSCITQDHLGFIWIGTLNGLNRFDGTEFQIYKKKR